MAQLKYGKYFITETPPNPRHSATRVKGNPMPWENTLYSSEGMRGVVAGAPHLETNMVVRSTKKRDNAGSRPHSYPFGAPEIQCDLGGEIEFWVGDAKQFINRSCAVYVPGGIPHRPFYVQRVAGLSCLQRPPIRRGIARRLLIRIEIMTFPEMSSKARLVQLFGRDRPERMFAQG